MKGFWFTRTSCNFILQYWNHLIFGIGFLGEFWIGNEALHRLTAANLSSLRIDLVDIYGKAWYAEYDEFSVSNQTDGYRLTVSGYHGNASDALNYQNHMQFSAIDVDRDVSNTHCAANYEGGWSVLVFYVLLFKGDIVFY